MDDERRLERGEVAEDLLKVKPVVSASIGATVSVFLAGSLATTVIAAASHASLFALSSFRNAFSESFLDFFETEVIGIKLRSGFVRNILSRVTEEGVENDDVDELGHGIEVSPQAA